MKQRTAGKTAEAGSHGRAEHRRKLYAGIIILKSSLINTQKSLSGMCLTGFFLYKTVLPFMGAVFI